MLIKSTDNTIDDFCTNNIQFIFYWLAINIYRWWILSLLQQWIIICYWIWYDFEQISISCESGYLLDHSIYLLIFACFIHNKCPSKPCTAFCFVFLSLLSFSSVSYFPLQLHILIVFSISLSYGVGGEKKTKSVKYRSKEMEMFFGEDSLEIEYKWLVSLETLFLQMSLNAIKK